jgi:hypothetical protein
VELKRVFAQALDSLDNGAMSQVCQGLASRDTDDFKNEFSRRLAQLADEQVVGLTEAEPRDNPAKCPLPAKYCLKAG